MPCVNEARVARRLARFGALALAGLAILGPIAAARAETPAAAEGAGFDTVFSANGEPAWLHYRADYSDMHGAHRIEVWRDHEARIRRVTDERIDMLASRVDDEVRFVVTDRERRVRTVVDRSKLMRVGLFLDWFAQGHALARPLGGYSLIRVGDGEPADGRTCVRWRLAPAAGTAASDICWSDELKLPLLIRDGSGRVQWRVTAIDTASIADEVFATPADGAADIDMNAELGPETD
jgi:hypothetical protein